MVWLTLWVTLVSLPSLGGPLACLLTTMSREGPAGTCGHHRMVGTWQQGRRVDVRPSKETDARDCPVS